MARVFDEERFCKAVNDALIRRGYGGTAVLLDATGMSHSVLNAIRYRGKLNHLKAYVAICDYYGWPIEEFMK